MTCNYFSNAAPCVYQNVNASIITGCMFSLRISEPSRCQSHLKIKSQISRQLDNRSDSQYSLSWQAFCSLHQSQGHCNVPNRRRLSFISRSGSKWRKWAELCVRTPPHTPCSANGGSLRCQPTPLSSPCTSRAVPSLKAAEPLPVEGWHYENSIYTRLPSQGAWFNQWRTSPEELCSFMVTKRGSQVSTYLSNGLSWFCLKLFMQIRKKEQCLVLKNKCQNF